MNRYLVYIVLNLLMVNWSFAQTYPDNEDGLYQDMLTPSYYLAPQGDPFRNEINKFVYFARAVEFQHPLQDPNGDLPQNITPNFGKFGAGKGPDGMQQHHAAMDFRVENGTTNVNIFAPHEGKVAIFRDAPKYRHYISITKIVKDSMGNELGKLVSLCAHVDLDLDSPEGLDIDGKMLEKGDLLSKNLYAGTVGGPHLHFEIRFYRQSEEGTEEFYAFVGPSGSEIFTDISQGPWSYGYWNPHIGYGYGDPLNHFPDISTSTSKIEMEDPLIFYPNPVEDQLTIHSLKNEVISRVVIFDLMGKEWKQWNFSGQSRLNLNLHMLPRGIYEVLVTNKFSKEIDHFRFYKK